MDSERDSSDKLWESLLRSELPIVKDLMSVVETAGSVSTSMFEAECYEPAEANLNRRLSVNEMLNSSSQSNESRKRYRCIGEAIRELLHWWSQNPSLAVAHVQMCIEPDIMFFLWARADSMEVICGFEGRDARLLSVERGKEFFGPDWEPALGAEF